MYLYNRYSLLFVKIGILLAYLGVSYWALVNKMSLPIYVDVFFFLLFLDFKNILNLKNYYSVYVFLIFKLSAGFWYEFDYKLPFDGTLYFIAFLLGYEIKNVLTDNSIVENNKVDPSKYGKYIQTLEFLIKVFVVLKLIYLIVLVTQYGFSSFYSGQMLADRISNYGRKSVIDSLLTVYSAFVDNFIIAIIVLYVRYKAVAGEKPNYYYLIVPLLVLPFLVLSRSTFAFNVVTLLAIYAYFAKNIVRVYAFLVPGAVILFAVTVYIGFLRLNSYQTTEDFSDVTSGDQFFTELTPIVAYKGVKDNLQTLNYQYGKTIVLPLLFKPIPRGIWQTKPNNSGALYIKEFDTGSYYAGFMIPLMIFGDLFINFGIYITFILLILFGVIISRFNYIFISKSNYKIDNYLILFVSFYSLLRNCLPESLIAIVLMYISKILIEFFILKTYKKDI